ncbi:unnamed protein product, partial [Toxocara canis]|uniref:Uncharacterized protein n=1 Tax=Toxocara canis TaxID=6265 RepID=A0A183U4M4_TOXCA
MLITSNERDTSSDQANPTEWPSDIIIRTPRIQDSMIMLSPFRPNILYTVFPTLQSKSSPYYCEQNQHNFQITCLPGKALRYDLRIFCEEYSTTCGIPNINLYTRRSSQTSSDGRSSSYGQRQKSGVVGVGQSFKLGLGTIPGLEVLASRGIDVGPVPVLDQMDGIVVNQDINLGILGQRISTRPAHSMTTAALSY